MPNEDLAAARWPLLESEATRDKTAKWQSASATTTAALNASESHGAGIEEVGIGNMPCGIVGMPNMPGSIGRMPIGGTIGPPGGTATAGSKPQGNPPIRGEEVVPRLLAIDMNFADGFRNLDKSHFNATACWWGGNDRNCRVALSSRSLSSTNLSKASGEAPNIALFQAVHVSLLLTRSDCACNSRTRAIITFDGFCTSPVSGRAMSFRWLVGLKQRIFPAASSLIWFSERKFSTSSTRVGLRRRLSLRLLDVAELDRAADSDSLERFRLRRRPPSCMRECALADKEPPLLIGGTPNGGKPFASTPAMGPLAAIMPISMPICSGSQAEAIGHSFVLCGPAQVAQIHLESDWGFRRLGASASCSSRRLRRITSRLRERAMP